MFCASSEEISEITAYAGDAFSAYAFESKVVEYSKPSGDTARIHLSMNELPRIELERNSDGSLTEKCFCSVSSSHMEINEEEFTSFYMISFNFFFIWANQHAGMKSYKTSAYLTSERVITEKEMKENPDILKTKDRVFQIFSFQYPLVNLMPRLLASLYIVPEICRTVTFSIGAVSSLVFSAAPKLICGNTYSESFKKPSQWLEASCDSVAAIGCLAFAIISPTSALKVAKDSIKGDVSDLNFRTFEALEDYQGMKRLPCL